MGNKFCLTEQFQSSDFGAARALLRVRVLCYGTGRPIVLGNVATSVQLGKLRFCEIVTGSPEPAPECNRFPNRRFTSQARSPRSIHVRWELTAPKVEPADRCLTHLGKSLKRRG